MVDPRPLKIRARDLDDMSVLAAMLQDAVVRPAEMTYLAREKRFVMVMSRFRWEDPEVAPDSAGDEATEAAETTDGELPGPETDAGEPEDARFEDAGPRQLYERVNAGLCVEKVRRVQTQSLNLKDKDQVLSLLTVEARPGVLTLVFSGGALVRLEVGSIACFLEDLGEPWATPWRPLHEAEDEEVSPAESAEPGSGR